MKATDTNTNTNTNTSAATVAATLDGQKYAVIVRRYWDRVAPFKQYAQRVTTLDWLRNATGEGERRLFRARVERSYTPAGYLPTRWTCRRWGDNRKAIDVYDIVPTAEAVKAAEFEREGV